MFLRMTDFINEISMELEIKCHNARKRCYNVVSTTDQYY